MWTLRPAIGVCLVLASLPSAAAVHEQGSAGGGRIADRIRGRQVAAALPPLDQPECRPAARADHMRADDVVFGVVVAGRARAYPWWIVKNHHVVNDSAGSVPLALVFCEQCTGAAAFRRQLDRRVLSFRVPGVLNGTIILEDRETGTLWAPFSGGLEGPLAAGSSSASRCRSRPGTSGSRGIRRPTSCSRGLPNCAAGTAPGTPPEVGHRERDGVDASRAGHPPPRERARLRDRGPVGARRIRSESSRPGRGA